MQTQRINITLPTPLVRQLRSEIPAGKRSKFIANAVSDKLTSKRSIQKELERSLKANYAFYKNIAKEWAVTEIEGWPD